MTKISGEYKLRDFDRLVMLTFKDKEDSDAKEDGDSEENAEEPDPEAESEEPAEEPAEEQAEEPAEEIPEEAIVEEEPTVAYPAADFTDSASGVSVSVHAPEGALPEGTTRNGQ